MSIAMSREERESFLAGLHVGVISIADGEAAPLSCPVWYSYEPGGEILVVTGKGSRKAALLAKAGRASFLVQSEELPYKYVSVEGLVAAPTTADLEKHVRPIAHRYLGADVGDAYLVATRGENPEGDVLIRIQPQRWRTVDYAKRF